MYLVYKTLTYNELIIYICGITIKCLACTQWFWGEECENACTCDDAKTSFCNKTNGFCSCVSGWKGENCTENVDECHDGGNKCGRNSTCNDTIGSYTCACDEGYQKNNNDSCKGQ